jgi:PhzF family phenazine biosynthesis protein
VKIPIYQIDAFSAARFGGNPAAVMPLPRYFSDDTLRSIAQENNLPETAFLVRDGDDWRLRWFTPTTEVPLCGHATLASAWVVNERLDPGRTRIVFHSASGPLTAQRHGEHFVLDFPMRPMTPVEVPEGLADALGAEPLEVLHDTFNWVGVLDSAATVRALSPDISGIARLSGAVGVIVTASGDRGYDCVSRYFAPLKGIPEDPVTGGAHCALVPYWSERLGKPEIRAFQASARGGELVGRVNGDRVELGGACVFYMEGVVEL